jgi:hypothetical protein
VVVPDAAPGAAIDAEAADSAGTSTAPPQAPHRAIFPAKESGALNFVPHNGHSA